MQTIITTFLIVSTVSTLYWWTNQQGNNATAVSPGVTLLKNNVFFAILGYVCAAMFVGLIALASFVGLGDEDDFWYAIASFAIVLPLTGYGCFYCLAYYRRHRVELTAGGMTVYDAWGCSKTAAWADIKSADFNSFMNEIRVYTKDGERLRISSLLYGLDVFRAELAKHHPYLVQRTLRP
ncbi:hypothetical protein [Parapedobacter koreensis]|uniref:PH domain-containing protein n=1 Tax=Parapedobacter koreensis TaxID=332977 RepID=A0A1H7PYF4_9SPHI|nr:hypothetical protein [Parapedobacter koreensis]SEL40518.1 hypothetical protein SAMN05421740_10567 [Parapedobacter koreensis]